MNHQYQPHQNPPVLMPILDAPGLFADAMLTDEGNNLLFLSLWGRDTAVQEFRARLSLPVRESGLDSFRLRLGSETKALIQLGDPERLLSDSGRTSPQMLFGSLVHLWLYNRLAVEPDRANRRALLLYQPMELSSANGRSRLVSRLWSQVMATCHLPLLPGWRNTILQSFQSRGWIKTLKGIGLQAYVIDLSDDAIEDVITQLIHSRELRATD
ncbi:hypothetical protein [Thiolapillus sp.]|uniref:hypothetical protein n=1 Tax=Thiolapillus sp. TaxID=2017437 RepID=UPI003AF5E5F0